MVPSGPSANLGERLAISEAPASPGSRAVCDSTTRSHGVFSGHADDEDVARSGLEADDAPAGWIKGTIRVIPEFVWVLQWLGLGRPVLRPRVAGLDARHDARVWISLISSAGTRSFQDSEVRSLTEKRNCVHERDEARA
jgi:hypothetical protein